MGGGAVSSKVDEARERGELLLRIVSLRSSLAGRGCGRSGDKSSERESDVGRLPKETTDERTGCCASFRCRICNQASALGSVQKHAASHIGQILILITLGCSCRYLVFVTFWIFFVKNKTDIGDENLFNNC